MATPNVGILTTTGKALIDKVNSGQAKISFSKVVFSSMDNSQLSDTQIKALTAIAPQEVVVSSPQTTLDTNSGETRIRATGTNEKLADGVYVKTYGVFAKDDTGNEILYGVTVSPNPNYFPAYDGVTPQAVTYSYKTVIQETSNITMTNSNDVYVSQEDLTEAIAKIPQPDLSGYDKTDDVDKKLQNKQDKLGYTAANDSTVVHTADMRKPASDVVGLEDITQTALPDGTDFYTLLNTVGRPLQYFANGFVHAQTMINKPKSTLSTFILITIAVNNRPVVIYNYTFLNLRDISTGDSYEALISTDGTGKITVARPWHKLADDSKVAHLSGANNFDTVPTVNNNPLLLASSLPSDLARLSQDANFTAKLQQNGQDVALANNTIARNPDTGVVSEPVDFTKLTVNGGKSVATSDDLKSVETSAWRQLDAAKITVGSGQIYAGTFVLYKLDTTINRLYFIFTVSVNGSTDISLDFSNVVKHISTPSLKDFSNKFMQANNSTVSTFGVSNNLIDIYSGYGNYYSLYSTYTVNGSPEYNFCFVNYDELV